MRENSCLQGAARHLDVSWSRPLRRRWTGLLVRNGCGRRRLHLGQVFRSGIHRKIPRTPLEAVSDGSYGAIEPLWHNRCDPSIRKHSDSCCSESRCSGGNQERDFLGRILRACDKPRFRSASKSVLGEAM